MKIMTPTIHMNGSNAESLKNEYMAAYRAASDLIHAFHRIDLHARDYYVKPEPDAFEQARNESSARYMAVRRIREELEFIILAIQTQQPSPKV